MDVSSACVQTVQMMPCKMMAHISTVIIRIVKIIGHLFFGFGDEDHLTPNNVVISTLCCRAWTMALQDARINTVSSPTP